jgi:mono/diheme cytochrome c family protein
MNNSGKIVGTVVFAVVAIHLGLLCSGRTLLVAAEESKSAMATRTASPGEITYAKHVAPIIQNKCQTCHRPGMAAPFSLSKYDDVVDWSETIKEVVEQKRMPPWLADARFGKFRNDRRLSDAERETLIKWIDADMPMGDEKDLPPAKQYSEGWMIGKPDVVFELPQEVTVQATGTVPYQYYTTPTNFKEDVWVAAAEARPGNRKVVHHIIVSFRDPKVRQQGGRGLGDGHVVGTAPGDMPLILPTGVARKIPAGSTLIWQMHYTPTGQVEIDRSQLGLVFYKEKQPPKYSELTRGISQRRLAIPPGDANHQVESEFTFPADAILHSFMPHMHLRGKDFKYEATYPDGSTETLLSVPRYDFGWQSTYILEQPLRMPKGTKIHCTAHFDNSPGNRANPDPTKEVRWGDQTWEEMMIGWINYAWEKPPVDPVAAGLQLF